jgi:hypothetical protein
MQHIFLVALALAMYVPFNHNDSGARKAKVLAAYRTLEKPKRGESG